MCVQIQQNDACLYWSSINSQLFFIQDISSILTTVYEYYIYTLVS